MLPNPLLPPRARRALAAAALATLASLFAPIPPPSFAAISSSGSVSPSPPQTAGADPIIGVNDLGRFTITPSSVVNSDVATIGAQFTGIGYVVVSGFDSATGSGAVWNTQNIIVGNFGTGTLEILDGAVVNVDSLGNPGTGDLSIGLNADSLGTVRVSGRGSLLRIGDDTLIGHSFGGPSGSGTLIIEDEGFVIATNDAATGQDVLTVGTRGRVELSGGRLRTEFLTNNGAIVGSGRVDNESTISNAVGGRFEVRSGDRLVVNAGPEGGIAIDNDGEIVVAGGEIEFLGALLNSNAGARVTLRDGGTVRFPRTGFGFDSTGGVVASTAGVNDIFGTVRIQGASSRIVVAGGSTAVFHDPVTNAGGAIEVFPGSTPVFLQGLTLAAAPLLAVHVTDPTVESNVVEVSGAAQLAGTLDITLASSYLPQPGDRFPVLTAGSRSGTFSGVTASDPGDGLEYHALYTATDVVVFTTAAGVRTWGVDAGGDASDRGNWFGGVAPGGIDDRIAFTTIISDDRKVAIDAPLTVGAITFDDDNAYVLQGPATVTLDVTSGNARIDVSDRHGRTTHAIDAPLVLNDDTVIDIASGSALRATQPIIASGASVAKDGPGTLAVRSLHAEKLLLNAGTVSILPAGDDAGVSVLHAISIEGAPGHYVATLDLNDNDLIVHDGDLDAIAEFIATARNAPDGRWQGSGITTSAAISNPLTGLAAILNPGFATFSGQPVDANDILIKFTWNGDANLDGIINADDYFRIDSGFLARPANPTYRDGDFNYDSAINADDYFLIDSAFLGQGAPLALGAIPSIVFPASVPEPLFALPGLAAMLLVRRSGRHIR